jgi:hypothetical protein
MFNNKIKQFSNEYIFLDLQKFWSPERAIL